MIPLRFIACMLLYGSIYGAVYVINELMEGQSHSMVAWASVFGEPFLSALGVTICVILFLGWFSKTKW